MQGDIVIRANAIEITGTAPGLPFPSELLTFSGGIPRILGNVGNVNATGKGGTLDLLTQQLSLRGGAVAAAGSLNANNNAEGAGNIRIQAQTIRLDQQSRLLTETASRDGGEISLQVKDALVLGRDRNLISATAGVEQQSGNGGNIRINGGSIVSSFPENNDIRANAFSGSGGRVEITADAVLGIAPRASPIQDTTLSDITASSEFGVSGTIQLNLPLEEKSELLRSRHRLPQQQVLRSPTPTPRIPVEAQGWIVGIDRQVRLVAQLQLSAPRHTGVPDTGLCR